MCFESFGNGPDNFMISGRFSFSIKGNGSFLCGCGLTRFFSIFFDPMQCGYVIGLNVDETNKSTS